MPLKGVEITGLFDFWSSDSRLHTAWGFSALVTLEDGNKLLFDTGSEGLKLVHNMDVLGYDIEDFQWIVLSHEHWDHIGGVEVLLNKGTRAEIFLPKVFSKSTKSSFTRLGGTLRETQGPVEVASDVYTSGVMGDEIPEQSLVILTSKGAVLITGCAHPGIDRIVEEVSSRFGRILLVVGGFHLQGASAQRIGEIAKVFIRNKVGFVAPCHCSGEKAQTIFKEIYGENYIQFAAGDRINTQEL